MRIDKTEVSSLREPADDKMEKEWWSIWATHVTNDAIITETAQTFGISRTSAWRAIRWCAEALKEGRVTGAVAEAVAYAKRLRLRAIRQRREMCWETDEDQAAIGYLREERELENEIAAIEGVVAKQGRFELTGEGGGPVKHDHTGSALERLAETVARLAEPGEAEAGDSNTD